jgi:amidophosphoribosyltransferase
LRHWREECGVFGVWGHEEASRLTFLGLYAQQHRGQESAGIVSLFQKKHFVKRQLGLVTEVFEESDFQNKLLPGSAAIGHVRYSTTGENHLANVQPLAAQLLSGPLAIAHNGNLVNAHLLRRQLQQSGAIFQGTNDTECLLHLLAASPESVLVSALKQSLIKAEGAYSLVVLAHDQLIAVRDPHGFRPLVLGKMKNISGTEAWVVCSETCALDLIGAKYEREIEPGEILSITADGLRSERLHAKPMARCVFEHIYFARPDSQVFSRSVYQSRKDFGRWLAKESPVSADLIVPVPDSGVPAALGFSDEAGIPFEFGIIRNHYVGRTFIQPHQSVRDLGVRIKLNPQPHLLRGRSVVVVDDSLVRGTTSQKIVAMLKSAGAREVHMRIASPPTTGPCYYGVDTPQKSQLIAAHQSVEEIRKFIGAESLAYLSIAGMFSALGTQASAVQAGFCAACFDGRYPTETYAGETP